MSEQKKIVKIIALIMAVIGILLLLVGLISGFRLLIILFGIGFMISGYIAYKSGVSYLQEQIEEEKNKNDRNLNA